MRTLTLPEFRNRKFDLNVLSSEILWTMLQFPSSDRTVTCVGVSRETVERKKNATNKTVCQMDHRLLTLSHNQMETI